MRQLGSNLTPKSDQDASKTPPRCLQEAPSWCPRRPRSRPRGAQDASGTAQQLPKRPTGALEPADAQERPQSAQQPPKSAEEAPKSPKEPPRADGVALLWTTFCLFLVGFPPLLPLPCGSMAVRSSVLAVAENKNEKYRVSAKKFQHSAVRVRDSAARWIVTTDGGAILIRI